MNQPLSTDLSTEPITTQTAAVNLGYMRQIDALRAFAVGGVLMCHYLGEHISILNWGGLGVRLFFVISGFLITGILLNVRLEAGNAVSIPSVAAQFYARRALRIFPIFYATIFIAAILGMPNVRESFFWHVTYATNFWVAEHGWVNPVAHLWSLAVEEQFYLLWPWVILFTPKRWLATICVGSIGIGVTYRLIVVKLGGWLWSSVMLPGCLDSLGAGALLAIILHDGTFSSKYVGRVLAVLAIVGAFLIFVVQPLLADSITGKTLNVMNDTWFAMIFVWMVHACAVGVTGFPGQLLLIPPILYIGRISYGIYVLHQFVPAGLKQLADFCLVPYPTDPWLLTIIYTTITIALASLSWRFFEKPLNDLKRYFPYVKARDKSADENITEVVLNRR
ncbi:MAG: acyltransferase [Pirellula sp.]